MALGKKTGGRRKGSKNKRTKALEKATAEAVAVIEGAIANPFQGDAHAFHISVYKNPAFPLNVRLDAAKSALPYEKHRLASVQHSGSDGGPIHVTIQGDDASLL